MCGRQMDDVDHTDSEVRFDGKNPCKACERASKIDNERLLAEEHNAAVEVMGK